MFAGIALVCFVLLSPLRGMPIRLGQTTAVSVVHPATYAYLLLGVVCAVGAAIAKPGKPTLFAAIAADMIASVGLGL